MTIDANIELPFPAFSTEPFVAVLIVIALNFFGVFEKLLFVIVIFIVDFFFTVLFQALKVETFFGMVLMLVKKKFFFV